VRESDIVSNVRFRVLFALFNIVILAACAVIAVLPLVVMGGEYADLFWRSIWPLGIVMVVLLAAINTYFGVNWRLFGLIEREDWSGLIDYLEADVTSGRRAGSRRVHYLIYAYVGTEQPERITVLEHKLREHRPSLVGRFALEFGVPYLLRNEPAAMERYYGEMTERADCSEPLWVRWGYAFALSQQRRNDDARAELSVIAPEAKDPILKLLTAYLLDTIGARDETRIMVNQLRSQVRSQLAGQRWERELERRRASLHVLVLLRLISDARAWAFGTGDT
jgi:hypothetical protein